MATKKLKKSGPIWHPFTQHGLYPEMTKITHATGAYLYTEDGTRIIDAIASWWVITHAHGHPHIRAAIQTQSEHLDQVIFGGFTHEPAERAAQMLLEITSDGLDYVFFSDSGSTAVEVAVKMALGFWHNQGAAKRNKILALEEGYHGDTIGTMSLGAPSAFNAPYDPLLFDIDRIPSPGVDPQACLDMLEEKCRHEASDIAALIVEPLVQGAGGMLFYEPKILRQMREICALHDVLFIADEVMTGWGRTGKMFACDEADIVPDIACYAKGLTGGFLPLAATMCSEEIFNAHLSKDRAKTFFHSSSFTANPLACAAAVANLEIWEHEPVANRIASLNAQHQQRIEKLQQNPNFENARTKGTIAAVELKGAKTGYLAEIGPKLYDFFQEKNILMRPLGATIYILPPYCISPDDLDTVYDAIEEAGEEFAK